MVLSGLVQVDTCGCKLCVCVCRILIMVLSGLVQVDTCGCKLCVCV